MPDDLSSSNLAVSRFSIRDFLVDFLGGLVPGVLFIFLTLVSLGWSAWTAIREVQKASPVSPQILETITDFATAFRFEIILFFLVAAYVSGHFFFRQDPKTPDKKSFLRAKKAFSEKDEKDWAVRKTPKDAEKERNKDFEQQPEEDSTDNSQKGTEDEIQYEFDVQFPYLFLGEYLEARSLKHLAELVPWRGSNPGTWSKRTKSLINLLKIRVLFHFPERCGTITRNEAHIRLMSSVWYASRALMVVAVLGIVIGLIPLILGLERLGTILPQNLIPSLFSAAILGTAFWSRRSIERFLHYQRLREIIFVLETAYIAARTKPDLGILEDLS